MERRRTADTRVDHLENELDRMRTWRHDTMIPAFAELREQVIRQGERLGHVERRGAAVTWPMLRLVIGASLTTATIAVAITLWILSRK